MIWILWIVFIVLDSLLHSYLIKNKYDINHYIAASYRIVIAVTLYMFTGINNFKHFNIYLFGAFFSFWLLFNILLNYWRQLPIEYLGKASWLDRLESKVPFIASAFWKLVLAIGLIYGYYNAELI